LQSSVLRYYELHSWLSRIYLGYKAKTHEKKGVPEHFGRCTTSFNRDHADAKRSLQKTAKR
jgi:hypothetical protein